MLRQIIKAEVEGCGGFGFASFDLGFDADNAGLDGRGVLSPEPSPTFWVLFFFFVMVVANGCVIEM